ncbi:MAG TPA: hypothetical protein VFE50_06405 [Cyclobacteriaceae bacterium]|nr:hypothetical protein [Cyclobacteriaceae bacterium]
MLSENGKIICEAISKMQRLGFVYNGKPRVAEPQFYGIGNKGHEQVRVYQVNIKPHQEKLLDVAKIQRLELLQESFTKAGPNYNPNDSAFRVEICKLK